MKKLKRIIESMFIFFIFCSMTMATIMICVGTWKWANALVTNTYPTFFEWMAVAVVALIGGTIGVVWYICDTE